jgi:hypothetical protein
MSISFTVKTDDLEGATVKLFKSASSEEPSEILRSIVLFEDDLDETEEFDSSCWNSEQRIWAHIVGELLSVPEDPESRVAWYAAVEFASLVLPSRFIPRQILLEASGGKQVVLTAKTIKNKLETEMEDQGGFILLFGPWNRVLSIRTTASQFFRCRFRTRSDQSQDDRLLGAGTAFSIECF